MTLPEALSTIANAIDGHGELLIYSESEEWMAVWSCEGADKAIATGDSLEAAIINLAQQEVTR